MSAVIPASFANIPIAHIGGGEITEGAFDDVIRHSLTKFSHLHFVSNKDSYQRVQKLGEVQDFIYNVGCPRIDLIKKIIKDKKSNILKDIHRFGVGDIKKIEDNESFLIVLQHPVTTEFSHSKINIKKTFNALTNFNIKKIILWPNADAGYEDITKEIRKAREKRE